MGRITSGIILICLLSNVQHFGNSLGVVDVIKMLSFGSSIMLDGLEIMELIPDNHAFRGGMDKKLMDRISRVTNQLDKFENQMDTKMDVMSELLTISAEIPSRIDLEEKLRTLGQFVSKIDDLYRVFKLYIKTPDRFEKYTLEDFVETCVSSRSDALPDLLKTIHRLLVPPDDGINSKSILMSLAEQMKEAAPQICNEKQSLQQLLYNLYSTVTLTEIKGYSMIQFSYKMLRLYNSGSNFTEEMKIVKQQYENRTLETLRAVKTAMAFAPRQVWRCDAAKPKLDETYTTLNQLFQGYIVNEVDLNDKASCNENCAFYQYAKVRGCYKNQYCAQQRVCNGKILKCEFIDSDMWVCPSSEVNGRRYEYVEYENGRVFGKKGSCSRGTTKVDSWWRWLFWHCSYCFCYCDDNNGHSDRYFSLRKVVSDIANNKVVTGIRFKKVNQIMHIEIQEGELMPRGDINKTSVQWVPIEEFSVLDHGVKEGVDYHTLSWEKRIVDLDDLSYDKDYLLTGFKFRTLGSHLNLEIRMTQFNFTTGKLVKPFETSFWISHDKTDRNELKLDKPDIPTRILRSSVPDSKSEDQYLNFMPSDREADAAQNTVPFIDIQPVVPNPPVAIAGAGIYHKGMPRSGGFLALQLITYDFSNHLKVDIPPTRETVVRLNDMNV